MKPKAAAATRWWDLPSALILVVAIFLAALRLSATDWTDELGIIQTITFFGSVAGLALGQSLFSRRQVSGFATVFGLFILGWQLGNLFGKGILWSERLISLLGRLGISLENLFRQRAVTDPVLFLFLMGILFWILGSHAGYSLTRHANPWQATLPTGLALFVIHIHDPFWPSRTWFMATYIFLALLLLSRLNFLHNKVTWRQNRTHLPPYVGLDFLRATMVAGGMLVLLAWTVPALAASVSPARQAWQSIAGPWYEARSKMSNAFASLRATVGVVQDYYGEILPLGRGNALNDVIVLTVQAPTRPGAGVRYYWRARVYDTYDGTQWKTLPTESRDLSPDDPALPFADLEGRFEAGFTFMPGIPLSTIYTVPQPQWVSRPVNASVVVNSDNTIDLFALRASPNIRPGEIYEVRSSLTDVTVSQLREAETEYPEWVSERYLQIPESITPRTIELARQIAEESETPYDIAEAVTLWMRENIQYNETIPVPPSEQDIIDWMLFDLREGFCNYYATAEIIMLRSLGIPARLAVGYAQGHRDIESNTYTVRQRDAHAWPEVYFPGIGWVEFEPTINQRPLRRPIGEPSDENNPSLGTNSGSISDRTLEELLGFEPLEDQEPPTQIGARENLLTWIILAIVGGIIITVSTFAWYRSQKISKTPGFVMTPLPVKIEMGFKRIGLKPPAFLRQWAYVSGLPIQARAYQQLNRSLYRLGSPAKPNNTPAERAALLEGLLPNASNSIDILLQEYHVLTYGMVNGRQEDESQWVAKQAARNLRNLTWYAIGQRFLAKFQEPDRNRKSIV